MHHNKKTNEYMCLLYLNQLKTEEFEEMKMETEDGDTKVF